MTINWTQITYLPIKANSGTFEVGKEYLNWEGGMYFGSEENIFLHSVNPFEYDISGSSSLQVYTVGIVVLITVNSEIFLRITYCK